MLLFGAKNTAKRRHWQTNFLANVYRFWKLEAKQLASRRALIFYTGKYTGTLFYHPPVLTQNA